jgi:hypothetical protein
MLNIKIIFMLLMCNITVPLFVVEQSEDFLRDEEI